MERKKFLSGFLCGMAFALCLGTLVVVGNRVGWFDWIYQTSTGSEKITNVERRQTLQKLGLLERYIDRFYLNDLEADDYADGLYKGLVSSLDDRYAAYYNKEEYSSINAANEGKYVGIGCSVSFDKETGAFTIIKPYTDGPADKAGICSGDILVSIDGEPVAGKDLSEVVSIIKGEAGTEVSIEIQRGKSPKTMNMVVTRNEVETKTIIYTMLDHKIGYIGIAGFKENTVEQFEKAVDSLVKDGMVGLIMDVRNNGGGALTSVVAMSNRILSDGLIVYTRDKYDKGQEYYADDKQSLDVPMVLLVNGYSASASEVFAAALKDHGVATLVGTKTYGKGIVQSIFDLEDGSAIKLTTSKYFTPNGYNIHEKGIEPDIVVEQKVDDAEFDVESEEIPDPAKDNQMKAAIDCMEGKLSGSR
ncbi:MAG: S41 family peptidase [Clostridium sp.]|nr:S41 family peptidase [Clostridium sp.]